MQKTRRERHMMCVIKRVYVGASLIDQGLLLHYYDGRNFGCGQCCQENTLEAAKAYMFWKRW